MMQNFQHFLTEDGKWEDVSFWLEISLPYISIINENAVGLSVNEMVDSTQAGSFRDECLNETLFSSLTEARHHGLVPV